jgi:NADPH:quinone reductase-like Zn-dependent oxidoreductase
MKAIVHTRYGPPDVLELKEVGAPTPREDEALVKIHAASLNAADLEILRGVWSVRKEHMNEMAEAYTVSGLGVRVTCETRRYMLK